MMCCAAGIVAWEDGLELDYAVGIGFLDAPEEGRVEVGCVVCVAVTGCDETRVDARAVAVPDIPPQARDWLAGCHVHELCFDDNWDAGLGLADVGADVLS